jgi:HD superfamily phosphohydrolase
MTPAMTTKGSFKHHPIRPNLRNTRVIYDVLYGFVPITECEEQIINSPFFQRLRWIKQLSFANYIFPGAEHNRFAHVIGVMHSMQKMLENLGLAVPDSDLFDSKARSEEALLHKSLRIAALLHDIGTFPFSHTVEAGYLRHGSPHHEKAGRSKSPKNLPNSHEHLGSFIIKNTRYEGGLTQILEKFGLDPQMISKIIKGDSPYFIANQLMHSDLDADRMDYLIRDAHYTGIKYGQFDREYVLANLALYDVGNGQLGFGVRENALRAIEDFLIARFSWYSQVVKNTGSAKFDVLSTSIAHALLEHQILYKFQDLLQMIEDRDERFFWWNDTYFMTLCQLERLEKSIQDPHVHERIEMLLYRKPPKTVRHPSFGHRLLHNDTRDGERQRLSAEIQEHLLEMNRVLKKFGRGNEWLLADIPEKDVVFTNLARRGIQERDPIKVVSKSGTAQLLTDHEQSLLKPLSQYSNFIPSAYANPPAIALLTRKGLIP